MKPPSPRITDWMRLNGMDLQEKAGEEWVCLYSPTQDEVMVAHRLAKLGHAYFVPLRFNSKKNAFQALWPSYIFCRAALSDHQRVIDVSKSAKLLRTRLQEHLLSQLAETPPYVDIKRKLRRGYLVRLQTGPLANQEAYLLDDPEPQCTVVDVSYQLLGTWHQAAIPASNIEVIDPCAEIDKILPLRIHLEETHAAQAIDLELSRINQEFVAYLSKHPNQLHDLSPRRFEQLIADLLSDMGYTVTLTPATRDGGVDIFAALTTPIGKILTIVECKKYREDRKIGIEIVERFLYSIRDKFKASCGMIATTSFFSHDTHLIARQHEWQLKLKDYTDICSWLSHYGQWSRGDSSGLWLPQTIADMEHNSPNKASHLSGDPRQAAGR